MTWMPDREAATRRRRRTSSPQYHEPYTEQYAENEYGRIGRQRPSEAHPMGIPRILGRRARWVGARLRREA